MTGQWHTELLSDEHELGAFDCGEPSLNQWLVREARRAQSADTARTYAWTTSEGDVVAYYAIAPTQIYREELASRSLAGGYRVIPAFLLARLALDHSLQGQGYGSDLLVDALTTIVQASSTGSGGLIIVDALHEAAAAFYRHHDFISIEGTGRLIMKVATARKALGIASLRFTPSPDTQLGSIVVHTPEGVPVPTVVTLTELEAVVGRLTKLAERQEGDAETVIDLNDVLIEVLGRDPLTEIGVSDRL